MNTILNILCMNCLYIEKFKLGEWELKEQTIKDVLKYNVRDTNVSKEVLKREKKGIQLEKIYNELLKCNNCHRLYSKVVLEYNDGYTSEYNCKLCGGLLSAFDYTLIRNIQCPECKELNLMFSKHTYQLEE